MNLFENSLIYKALIDPIFSDLHQKTIETLNPKRKIIDIACGTGSFVFKLAKKAEFVLGIDISREMIKKANKFKHKQSIKNVEFRVLNASNLTLFKENEYDIATISMVTHQLPIETSKSILLDLKRISKQIIIIDYSIPLPNNIYKYIIHFMERIAGKLNYYYFKNFLKYGGIKTFLKDCKLKINRYEIFENKLFEIIQCR